MQKKILSITLPVRVAVVFALVSLLFTAMPSTSHASVFSLLSSLINSKKEVKETQNSQTVVLPKAMLALDQGARGGGDITIVDDIALLPDSGPLGASAGEIDENAAERISVYVVRKGDTLSGISKMFGVSRNTIIWANDIQNGIIAEGQKLVILPVSGIRHTVKDGDTAKKIADKYKADINEIYVFNGLSPEAKLAVGETLIIPDGEGAIISYGVNNASSKSTARLRGASGPSYEGYYIRPIVGGYRSQGLHGYNGVDLASSLGTPIMASAPGTVIIARQGGWNGGYGNYAVIQHGNGTQTLYSHMQRLAVESGALVDQGQVIGYMGSTGKSTGVHLHFEIRGAKNPY